MQEEYISSLEEILKEKYSEGMTAGTSFLEIKAQSQVKAKAKSKADPMLKSMLFGFPNPRKKTFGGFLSTYYFRWSEFSLLWRNEGLPKRLHC